MEQPVIYIALVLFGLIFGSFAGASVWRLRAKQLSLDKSDGENYDEVEYKKLKKLTNKTPLKDHSQCLNCSYKLRWYDMIPIISWLLLGGKCRKCRKSIGYFEPLIELGLAIFFVISFAFWPYALTNYFEIARLSLWIISGVVLAILFVYDMKWSLLPDQINFTLIGIGVINAFLVIINSHNTISTAISLVGSIVILSGLYWLIYIFSKGKWIGFGDIKLGLGLALLLADWKLAFIALFAANLVGCIIVLPPLLIGKLKRSSHIPFGPLLIIGFVISGLAGNYLLSLYLYSIL